MIQINKYIDGNKADLRQQRHVKILSRQCSKRWLTSMWLRGILGNARRLQTLLRRLLHSTEEEIRLFVHYSVTWLTTECSLITPESSPSSTTTSRAANRTCSARMSHIAYSDFFDRETVSSLSSRS